MVASWILAVCVVNKRQTTNSESRVVCTQTFGVLAPKKTRWSAFLEFLEVMKRRWLVCFGQESALVNHREGIPNPANNLSKDLSAQTFFDGLLACDAFLFRTHFPENRTHISVATNLYTTGRRLSEIQGVLIFTHKIVHSVQIRL